MRTLSDLFKGLQTTILGTGQSHLKSWIVLSLLEVETLQGSFLIIVKHVCNIYLSSCGS